MTFRLRVTILAALAVGLAAIGAASIMYVVLQGELTTQIDSSLVDAAAGARRLGPRLGSGPLPVTGAPPRLAGRVDIFGQVIDASGDVMRADGQSIASLVTDEAKAVAAGSSDPVFFDATIGGSRVRVYTAPFRSGQAIQLVRRFDEIDHVLVEARLRLGIVALGAMVLAAGLGAVVARGTLRPVRQLTELVEDITRTRDLSRRVRSSGHDEIARLAASFDVMLGALDESVRSQRRLVADASHELRTPLTSLRTNLELLARDQPADPDERREVLTDLVRQMERLSRLVSDLIDIARAEEVTLPIEDVELDALVADAVDGVGRRYPQARFVVDAKPSVVRGVPSRLARAVTNLLDNAGKWSPQGGTVEVRVGGSEVTVRDHGPGIAPDDAPHVFDRFWRAASARSLPGSGLGLAIVKDVAESHGGTVTLEHPEGGGARFRLRLPGQTA